MTSNKSFVDWGEVFNDQVLATAILDQFLHYATTLNIRARTTGYRENEGRAPGSAVHDGR